ncbi:hypothetical protein N7462_001117 [Penicillium macrosclerotiorum]|uniref:uncharacterized protein n=1 Tax=Penicillium macrosclerotiorum TaxID=303699 RepID=UPI0025471A7E|nr:uncharacterized protein N7462_001117 [Penicillium macrosclerotiorum]KAJ5699112.1 hypothetical protein N7462_001117 [Penicillium macrosclerotiorum]
MFCGKLPSMVDESKAAIEALRLESHNHFLQTKYSRFDAAKPIHVHMGQLWRRRSLHCLGYLHPRTHADRALGSVKGVLCGTWRQKFGNPVQIG